MLGSAQIAGVVFVAWLLATAGGAHGQSSTSHIEGKFGTDRGDGSGGIETTTMHCERRACTYTTRRWSIVYDKLEPVEASVFADAAFALAHVRKEKQWADVVLGPLVASGSTLRSCIYLRINKPWHQNAPLLCSLDRSPAVLMMNPTPHCDPVQCRYFIVALFKDHVSKADDGRPKGLNCDLAAPPAGSGEVQRGQLTYQVYPRKPDLGPRYTGCQMFWAVDDRWTASDRQPPALFWVLYFTHGKITRFWTAEIFGNWRVCHDQNLHLIEGRDGCPPPEFVQFKTYPAGCVSRYERHQPHCREE
jgi:hypothetical protein